MSELIGINLNINQILIQTHPRSNNYLIANQREVEKKISNKKQ